MREFRGQKPPREGALRYRRGPNCHIASLVTTPAVNRLRHITYRGLHVYLPKYRGIIWVVQNSVASSLKPVPHYNEARAALQYIDNAIVGGEDGESRDCLLRLINIILSPQSRIILYLGAGCSMQVKAGPVIAEKEYVPCSWLGLLKNMFESAPAHKRNSFIEAIAQTYGTPMPTFEELLPRFDRLQLAWFLTQCYESLADRNAAIKEIVEPPQSASRDSSLYQAIFELPFSDVITTNYDSNPSHFMERKTSERVIEIASTSELKKHLDGVRHQRIFYLHGKVDREQIVFDRQDYAELLEEREGLLDYVTFLLRGSHVIYIGFSLEDLSFNLLDTHLQMVSDHKRPASFAFLPRITERERSRWKERDLHIIEYSDHKHLPELLIKINTIRRFVNWAEPGRTDVASPLRIDTDRTGKYIEDALAAYVAGDFAASLAKSRAALATTLFWKRRPNGSLFRNNTFERVAKFVELRVRMALNHHKLRWSIQDDAPVEPSMHVRAARENLESGRAMLKEFVKEFPEQAGRETRILEHSINSLEGRLLYHEGKYLDALERYDEILRDEPDVDLITDTASRNDPKLGWELKVAEGFFYAKCQQARVVYQLRGDPRTQQGLSWQDVKQHTTQELKRLAEQLEQICRKLESWTEVSTEFNYYINSLAHIWQITLWTAGRYMTAICRDLLPTLEERLEPTNIALLNEAIKYLRDVPSIHGKQSLPPRWNAMRLRYLCRAHGLRWLLAENQKLSAPGERPRADMSNAYIGDLVMGHNALRDAFDQTRGAGLERQHIVNLLEGARFTLLESFGERILQTGAYFAYGSPSMAACADYLDRAFREIEQLLEKGEGEELEILGLRMAAYLFLVAKSWLAGNPEQIRNRVLRDLFSGNQDPVDVVRQRYQAFEKNMGSNNSLDRRIKDFEVTIGLLEKELPGPI